MKTIAAILLTTFILLLVDQTAAHARGATIPKPRISGGNIGGWKPRGSLISYINWWFEGGDFGGGYWEGEDSDGGSGGSGGSSGNGGNSGSSCGANACTKITKDAYGNCIFTPICGCWITFPKSTPKGTIVKGSCKEGSPIQVTCQRPGENCSGAVPE